MCSSMMKNYYTHTYLFGVKTQHLMIKTVDFDPIQL